MPVATLSAIPLQFVSGDTVKFTVGTEADYPVASWLASVVFSKDGIPMLSKTATVVDGEFSFTLTKDNTRSLPMGVYDVAVFVTDGTERATLASASQHECGCGCEYWPYDAAPWRVRVLPNLQDERPATKAEQMLSACEASILTLVVSPYTSTSFNGQSQTTRDLPQLMTMLERLRALVASERNTLCNGRDINIYPRFA